MAETGHRKAVLQTVACEFSVLLHAFSLMCVCDGSCARWTVDVKCRSNCAGEILFSSPGRVLRFFVNQFFMELLDGPSFDLAHVLFAFRRW